KHSPYSISKLTSSTATRSPKFLVKFCVLITTTEFHRMTNFQSFYQLGDTRTTPSTEIVCE
ncbi:MAG: hypothetical protein NTW48_00410, partial [Chloroflexi bacterium]|nr:hypothetical protein [Chloroflexota bacterium]